MSATSTNLLNLDNAVSVVGLALALFGGLVQPVSAQGGAPGALGYDPAKKVQVDLDWLRSTDVATPEAPSRHRVDLGWLRAVDSAEPVPAPQPAATVVNTHTVDLAPFRPSADAAREPPSRQPPPREPVPRVFSVTVGSDSPLPARQVLPDIVVRSGSPDTGLAQCRSFQEDAAAESRRFECPADGTVELGVQGPNGAFLRLPFEQSDDRLTIEWHDTQFAVTVDDSALGALSDTIDTQLRHMDFEPGAPLGELHALMGITAILDRPTKYSAPFGRSEARPTGTCAPPLDQLSIHWIESSRLGALALADLVDGTAAARATARRPVACDIILVEVPEEWTADTVDVWDGAADCVSLLTHLGQRAIGCRVERGRAGEAVKLSMAANGWILTTKAVASDATAVVGAVAREDGDGWTVWRHTADTLSFAPVPMELETVSDGTAATVPLAFAGFQSGGEPTPRSSAATAADIEEPRSGVKDFVAGYKVARISLCVGDQPEGCRSWDGWQVDVADPGGRGARFDIGLSDARGPLPASLPDAMELGLQLVPNNRNLFETAKDNGTFSIDEVFDLKVDLTPSTAVPVLSLPVPNVWTRLRLSGSDFLGEGSLDGSKVHFFASEAACNRGDPPPDDQGVVALPALTGGPGAVDDVFRLVEDLTPFGSWIAIRDAEGDRLTECRQAEPAFMTVAVADRDVSTVVNSVNLRVLRSSLPPTLLLISSDPTVPGRPAMVAAVMTEVYRIAEENGVLPLRLLYSTSTNSPRLLVDFTTMDGPRMSHDEALKLASAGQMDGAGQRPLSQLDSLVFEYGFVGIDRVIYVGPPLSRGLERRQLSVAWSYWVNGIPLMVLTEESGTGRPACAGWIEDALAHACYDSGSGAFFNYRYPSARAGILRGDALFVYLEDNANDGDVNRGARLDEFRSSLTKDHPSPGIRQAAGIASTLQEQMRGGAEAGDLGLQLALCRMMPPTVGPYLWHEEGGCDAVFRRVFTFQ